MVKTFRRESIGHLLQVAGLYGRGYHGHALKAVPTASRNYPVSAGSIDRSTQKRTAVGKRRDNLKEVRTTFDNARLQMLRAAEEKIWREERFYAAFGKLSPRFIERRKVAEAARREGKASGWIQIAAVFGVDADNLRKDYKAGKLDGDITRFIGKPSPGRHEVDLASMTLNANDWPMLDAALLHRSRGGEARRQKGKNAPRTRKGAFR
jgi:hypothetical protein